MDDVCVGDDETVESFSEVFGRACDMIDLGGGVRFHGYSLMVCAEENPKIIAYQLRVNRKVRAVTFVAQTLRLLTESEKEQIRRHAADVAAIEVGCIKIEEAKELVKAPSGKIRLVIEE